MSPEEEKIYHQVRYCNDQTETIEKADLDRVYTSGRPIFESIRLPKEAPRG